MATATSIRECQHPDCDYPLEEYQKRFCCRAHIGRTPDGAMNLGLARAAFNGTQEHLAPGSGAGICPHHWMIDIATGPTSKGLCRLCGESRPFRNYTPEDYRDWVKSA